MAKAALEIIKANFQRRAEIQQELRSIDLKATEEKRVYTEEESSAIVEHRSQLEEIDGRITANLEIEVRSQEIESGAANVLGALLDRDSAEVIDNRSIGRQFSEMEEYRSWVEGGARGVSPALQTKLEFRAVTDLTSAGALVNPERLGRVGQLNQDRRVYFLDLIPHIPVSTGSIEYVQDSTPLADLANKAVETAEGTAKQQAGVTMELITEPTATIPAWANITRQAAADAPQMMGYLDGRLRYALKRRADGQSINGNGTAPNLRGLLNRAGILAYAPGAAEDRAKSIRRGIRLGEDAEAVYEIILLNPADAEIFDLTNYGSAGLHVNNTDSGLAQSSARTAWGLTQVRSTAIPAGTALLVDPMALSVFDREAVAAYVTDSHASNFTLNILTLLLETRIGLGLFDPAGVCKITFNGTA